MPATSAIQIEAAPKRSDIGAFLLQHCPAAQETPWNKAKVIAQAEAALWASYAVQAKATNQERDQAVAKAQVAVFVDYLERTLADESECNDPDLL